MRLPGIISLLCIVTSCLAQDEVDFRIGRNHYPAFYNFKFLDGIDTLPMNYTYKFDFKEAMGKYDSLNAYGLNLKLNGSKAEITTPMSEGKAAFVLYKRQTNGKMKPMYVHYIKVRANRSQFDQ